MTEANQTPPPPAPPAPPAAPPAAKAEPKPAAKELGKVSIVGDLIGPFNIRLTPEEIAKAGRGFGTEAGTLTIGGVAIPCTRWDDQQIRGMMVEGAGGEVRVKIKGSTDYFSGVFPEPPAKK